MNAAYGGLFVLAISLLSTNPVMASDDDATLRAKMIAESIARYRGNCPCPYHRASNGSRCGKRSAWSRAGGQSPLCYESDISDKAVAAYRARQQRG